jgi:hypothetical protein
LNDVAELSGESFWIIEAINDKVDKLILTDNLKSGINEDLRN